MVMAAAAALVWFGMVLAISFIEAPLKFRAPGVTTGIGLGIGRIIFLALNIAETILAVAVGAALLVEGTARPGTFWLIAAIAVLVLQLAVIRPVLRRRTRRVLAGEDSGRRSQTHLVYIAAEAVKLACLMSGALLALHSV